MPEIVVSNYGITSNGFVKKDLQTILDELIQDAQLIFGANFDLRQTTPQYQMIAARAEKYAEIWDALEMLYISRYISLASGVALDYAVRYIGIRRNQPTKAVGTVTFTGTNGTNVPQDFLIQTESGIVFKTTNSGAITGGSVTLNVEALIAGLSGNVGIGAINVITNPTIGITSATNSSETTNGTNKESDADLKERYFKSLSLGGGSTTNAIKAAILQVTGVTDAVVRQNETAVTVNGIPPHSIAPVVSGGTDSAIQDAIYAYKGAGNQSFGTLTKNYTDENFNTITIGFSRPTGVNVWIKATVTKGPNYPVDGDTTLKTIVADHINSLGIGESVILFEILTKVAQGVTGITNMTLQSSTNGSTFTTADVTITGINEAQTDISKVSVV